MSDWPEKIQSTEFLTPHSTKATLPKLGLYYREFCGCLENHLIVYEENNKILKPTPSIASTNSLFFFLYTLNSPINKYTYYLGKQSDSGSKYKKFYCEIGIHT